MAYNNRGHNYYHLGQFERAIEDFNEAIRLDTEFALAYANRALAHTRLNMDAEAEQDFKRAEELGFDSETLRQEIEDLKKLR